MRGRLTAERGLGVLVLLAAAAYATYSLVRFSQYANGGFDLGIFDEVVWHYSRFETPASSVKGLETIWGDHFSPILMLLAPLYWLWEDARMLLLAQAALLAAAAVPIFLVCERRVGRRAALALAASYLAFWGVQAALAFDVHEVAFAPAIIAGLLLAIQRRRWRWYAGLVLALLVVKEDQAILVVFLGLYVATLGERRRGALTAVAGLAWYVAVTREIIEANNPAGFSYWSYEAFGSGPVSAAGGVLSDPVQALGTFVDSPVKRHTLTLLLLPFLGCACSRVRRSSSRRSWPSASCRATRATGAPRRTTRSRARRCSSSVPRAGSPPRRGSCRNGGGASSSVPARARCCSST